MTHRDIPKGWDIVYDPDKRRLVHQNRRSGLRQGTRPGPDTFYEEHNPEHNKFRVHHRPQSPSRRSESNLTNDPFSIFPEHLPWQSDNLSRQPGSQASFHFTDRTPDRRLPAPVYHRSRTAWDDLCDDPSYTRGDWNLPHSSNDAVSNNDSPYNIDEVTRQSNQAKSFSCMTTVACAEARFEPAWHHVSDLVRARDLARNAPMGNEESSRFVFEMPVQLLFIHSEYGSIIKLTRPSMNYLQSTRMEAIPILKVIRNPDRYQTDILFNVSTGERIVYELRQYSGRRPPNKQVKCYIREPANSGRNIVVLERKWDVLRKHPMTVTLTTDNYSHDRQHSVATEPRYMEIHKSKSDRTKSGLYEAVEFMDRRTAANVTSTAAPGIRAISVSPRVNISLLILIITAADMMWQ